MVSIGDQKLFQLIIKIALVTLITTLKQILPPNPTLSHNLNLSIEQVMLSDRSITTD